MSAKGRLADTAVLRGFAKVIRFGDGDKIFEIAKVHLKNVWLWANYTSIVVLYS